MRGCLPLSLCHSAQGQPVRWCSAEFTPVRQHSTAGKRQSLSIAFLVGCICYTGHEGWGDVFSYIHPSHSESGTQTSHLKFPFTLHVFSVLVRTISKNSLAMRDDYFFCNSIGSTLGGHWETTTLWRSGKGHLTQVLLKAQSLSSRA